MSCMAYILMRLTRMPRSTDRLKQTGNCTISQTRASSDVCTSVCPWPTYSSIRAFSVAKALIRGIHSSCVFVPFQILILLFGLLSFCSYAFLSIWRRNDERDDEFLPYSWEDEIVYKTSFAICAFSLAVSVGAALLLPISTISNEVSPPKVYYFQSVRTWQIPFQVLHRYPASWYMKWLNSSLINGIWNLIFVLSNVSLFIFLPFAYLFCESEGLPFFGNKRVSMRKLLRKTNSTVWVVSLF